MKKVLHITVSKDWKADMRADFKAIAAGKHENAPTYQGNRTKKAL